MTPDQPLAGRLCNVNIYAERGQLEGHATTRCDMELGQVLVIAGRDATPQEIARGWILIRADGTIQ